MIEKGICHKWFILNPINCEYECDRLCHVEEYLDYKNCKCRKRLFEKLVEECNKNINEKRLHPNKTIFNSTLNDYGKICTSCECSPCTIYIVLFAILFMISISISNVFICFYLYLKRK